MSDEQYKEYFKLLADVNGVIMTNLGPMSLETEKSINGSHTFTLRDLFVIGELNGPMGDDDPTGLTRSVNCVGERNE